MLQDSDAEDQPEAGELRAPAPRPPPHPALHLRSLPGQPRAMVRINIFCRVRLGKNQN